MVKLKIKCNDLNYDKNLYVHIRGLRRIHCVVETIVDCLIADSDYRKATNIYNIKRLPIKKTKASTIKK